MTKFELPEKPKKTNTSEDFDNLRKAVDELDKFDYTWKTYANKADRRINAANKYIEELERENQRLIANEKPQQALPVVPDFVAEWYEKKKNKLEIAVYSINTSIDKKSFNDLTKIEKWFEGVENKPIETIFKMKDGYTVEKPQLFYLREKNTNYYLNKSKNNGLELVPNPYFDEDNQFTKQEIDSMQTGSYELVPVEDEK